MYRSIKPWLNVSVTLMPFLKRTGTGDKLFKESRQLMCYPVEETKLVRNASGTEIISSTQLYINGTEAVTNLDNVIFNGTELPIQAISTYYRNGVADLKVVYL